MIKSDPKNDWTKKRRYLWRKDHKCMAKIDFHNLNRIDEYNHNMKNIDIANQLRLSYGFEHCMVKRKSWWLMFFW